MAAFIDLTGRRFGRLTAREWRKGTRRKAGRWRCECECGTETFVATRDLKSGNTRSCGCWTELMGQHSVTHGHTRGPRGAQRVPSIYVRWQHMIRRCTNPKNEKYPIYGGRGIGVCERWMKFENFFADMGEPPPGMSLDRIDVNGNYEPGNVRWATAKIQARNVRTNRLITHAGKTQTLAAWAEETGISHSRIRVRIDKLGWSVERALTEPAEIGKNQYR